MPLREWILRVWGRKGNSVATPTGIDVIRYRRAFAMPYLLSAFRQFLCCIDNDMALSPSSAPAYANEMHKMAGRKCLADTYIIPVAYGFLAGIILLCFDRFLRLEMIPHLKFSAQEDLTGISAEIQSSAWSGFEDEIMNKAKDEILEWGACYGVTKLDASMRTSYSIAAYEESGCKCFLMDGLLSWEHSKLFEENMRKNNKISEHVIMWLQLIAAPLNGLFAGFFGEQLQVISEMAKKDCEFVFGSKQA